MSFCWECGEQSVKDDEDNVKPKRKSRGRRCKKCKNAAIVKRRHKDPCALLQHRLYNTWRKLWPEATELWTIETIRMVWERCDKKSLISGETNPELLCISYQHKPRDKKDPPTIDDLVVITTKEAQVLAHCNLWDRVTKFEELKKRKKIIIRGSLFL